MFEAPSFEININSKNISEDIFIFLNTLNQLMEHFLLSPKKIESQNDVISFFEDFMDYVNFSMQRP
jgi:hypothetical protein